MLLVQLATRVSYISKSNVILRRDTIVDLPDGFNSRIAQFRMEDTRTETCCYRFISDTSQHPEYETVPSYLGFRVPVHRPGLSGEGVQAIIGPCCPRKNHVVFEYPVYKAFGPLFLFHAVPGRTMLSHLDVDNDIDNHRIVPDRFG